MQNEFTNNLVGFREEKLKKAVDGSTKSRTNDIVSELVINFNLMAANKMHMRSQCPFPSIFFLLGCLLQNGGEMDGEFRRHYFSTYSNK